MGPASDAQADSAARFTQMQSKRAALSGRPAHLTSDGYYGFLAGVVVVVVVVVAAGAAGAIAPAAAGAIAPAAAGAAASAAGAAGGVAAASAAGASVAAGSAGVSVAFGPQAATPNTTAAASRAAKPNLCFVMDLSSRPGA